jgi:hypothetical protein
MKKTAFLLVITLVVTMMSVSVPVGAVNEDGNNPTDIIFGNGTLTANLT